MKIDVRINERSHLSIGIPNFLVFSPLGALVLSKWKSIGYRRSAELMKALKQSRRALNGEPLVHVTQNGADKVKITL